MTFKHLAATGSGTLALGSAQVTLWTVNVNTAAASAVLKLYDGTSSAGTLVCSIDASTKSSHAFGVWCSTGLFYDLSGGNADVTIGYG